MGNVFAEITLKNTQDVYKAKDGHISEKDVRTVTITALVDTGASTLIIDESIRDKLGLSIIDTQIAYLAGGVEVTSKITEPVLIFWKDRITVVHAWVVPGEGQALLGVIPLEDMNLIVDPINMELIGGHRARISGYIR